jgi:hypothetical protein
MLSEEIVGSLNSWVPWLNTWISKNKNKIKIVSKVFILLELKI